jgi:hypothetical protein
MSLIVALIASAAIVLSSPFIGQLQSFLRGSLSTRNYVLLFGVGLLAAVGLAIAAAFMRIRERRAERFALLVVAMMVGGGYMWWTATPYAEVNAVERVHFVEYGAIAFLFYRAWRHAGDASIVILPLLAGFAVGTVDEWLQWFIPYRVGEAHDVFINLAALVCGLLFAVALLPPVSLRARLTSSSWRRLGAVLTIVWLIFAAFIDRVHLGHLVNAADIVRFRSHFNADELNVLQGQRAVLWQTAPPIGIKRLSREDQYLDEGLWHVRRRNLAEPEEAWHENLILERFFAPVLDFPTYASPDGSRWPPEQRANVAERVVKGAPFVSSAEPYPIVVWPRPAFWSIVALTAVACAIGPMTIGRRQQDTRS